MSFLNNEDGNFTVKAMYLGSEPMGELLEGENGSDVIQVPLKRTILRTNSVGKEVDLSVGSDSLLVNFFKNESAPMKLPIELLAYCGALRQLPPSQIISREFETLDKSPQMPADSSSPPLFVTIFRCLESENTLYCHSFVIRKDEEAMELVKLVMEMYYNYVRMNESINSSDENDLFNKSNGSNELNFNDLSQNKLYDQNQNAKTNLDYLLNFYNNQSTEDAQEKSVVSAKEIIKEALNSSEYKLEKNEAVAINEDDNPIVIKKENKEEIVYKQNVFIRWLQPPTPPPPAPIIIREVQDKQPESLPPLVIYKQSPRAPTPPPLIIRERPPTPIEIPKEPLVIERRVPVSEPNRKVIIEHLPPPPPKPRDIILEKWLPREPAPRSVYVQKSKEICYQKPAYEVLEKKNFKHGERASSMEKDGHRKSITRRSSSNEPAKTSQVYSNKNNKQTKIAGYRIIRQIIPGPNSTPIDIEKALARSQKVSCTVYSSHNQTYSPFYENSRYQSCYSSSPQKMPVRINTHTSKFSDSPDIYAPPSSCYSVLNYSSHPKARQVSVQQCYLPQKKFSNKMPKTYKCKEIYRSSSFDRI